MGLWGSFRPLLPHPMTARLLVFIVVARLLVCKDTFQLERGEWEGTKWVKNTTKLNVLTEIQLFFLNKSSSDCCKPLFNFQSSEKVTYFPYFFQCSHCFYRGAHFLRSFLCYARNTPVLLTILFFNWFIVVQLQLSAFTPHHPSHPHLPPLIPPRLVFVHESFIVA